VQSATMRCSQHFGQVKPMNETEVLNRWHTYYASGGSADFETFYSHTVENQKLLVKVAKGKALINRSA